MLVRQEKKHWIEVLARRIPNAGMTMQKGVSMKYYKTEEDDLVGVPDQVHTLISGFYSYLSDDSDQDAATTPTHLDNML
eukprot:15365441-Ditylum_brightwellii.AAC.1